MNKLDNILKQQMETFAPEAPNIWAEIEQGIQANAQNAVVTKSIAGKLTITIAKIAAILVIPASVVVYFVSNEKSIVIENKKVENTINTAPSKITEIEKPTVSKTIETPSSNKKSSTNIDLNKEVLKTKNISKQIHETENTISTTHKSTNLEQIIVSNKTDKVKEIANVNSEEILLKEEVEEIEIQETQGEVFSAENTVGIKSLPNVFTPDNDGINDKYVIDIEGEKFYNLKIYNYNNELIFESNDKNTNWDGINFKTGQACNTDIYYGILTYKLYNDDKNKTRMTKIKLIR